MDNQNTLLNEVSERDYRFGFVTDIETDIIPIGLSEEVVRIISAKKEEPEFMLEFRLKAYRKWLTMKMPDWAQLKIPEIDYQAISYYAAPRNQPKYESLDEVDPELLSTFAKLGIPLEEQKCWACGVGWSWTVFQLRLLSRRTWLNLASSSLVSEAVKHHPDLVQNISMVVPPNDNFAA